MLVWPNGFSYCVGKGQCKWDTHIHTHAGAEIKQVNIVRRAETSDARVLHGLPGRIAGGAAAVDATVTDRTLRHYS